MRRIPAALAPFLLAFASFALLRSSTCVVAVCSEHGCDPCLQQCLCSTCPHPTFEDSHRLVSYELLRSSGPDGGEQLTCAWIAGLSVARATGRADFTPRDLRGFAEGVLGVNHELLDLESALGHWEFGSVELAGEFALVSFTRVDAGGQPAEGALEFVLDARGALLEIDRTLPHP
jgi:hypothetical protein